MPIFKTLNTTTIEFMSENIKSFCSDLQCGKETTSNLKCPICLKQGIISCFCDEECYQNSYKQHKSLHWDEKAGEDKAYDPFKSFKYPGPLRAAYPLTPKRAIPENIVKAEWADNGIPVEEQQNDRLNSIPVYTKDEIKKIRKACIYGREVLDLAGAAVRPGITTDEIDAIVHEETIKRNCYPSPLNYYNFPKSVCTSVNEIVCHGVPDKTVLKEGDIVNIDVSVFYEGFHADLNETYYVGEEIDRDVINTVETARECLKKAIKSCKPGQTFCSLGDIIEAHADDMKCSVVTDYCGHGVGKYFHCAPQVPHYARNRAAGIMKPGMVFTIEPMINQGKHKCITWPDDWTASTIDGKVSAQFEHTLLVTNDGIDILTARTKKSPGGPKNRISLKKAKA
ncbi:Methionine aminopeptidase 1 [Hanseniaspora uvarum]